MVGISHYGAGKAALEYLTRSWALELAPDVRVNAIAPGPTESGALTETMGLSEVRCTSSGLRSTDLTIDLVNAWEEKTWQTRFWSPARRAVSVG